MDIRTYTVDISLLLRPINRPDCRISIGNQTQEFIVDQDTWIKLSLTGIGPYRLTVEHRNKRDSDPDTALIVEQIRFNEITSPRFVWEGIYYPNYPCHMSGQSELKAHNYLSWNGIWQLEFTLPIYTWIHKIEDLGWIYD